VAASGTPSRFIKGTSDPWVHDVNVTLAKARSTQRILQVIQADKPFLFFFASFASLREHYKSPSFISVLLLDDFGENAAGTEA